MNTHDDASLSHSGEGIATVVRAHRSEVAYRISMCCGGLKLFQCAVMSFVKAVAARSSA